MTKVIIVGGNMGGVTAAKTLLRAGVEVSLYEKKKEIGYSSPTFSLWMKGFLTEQSQLFHTRDSDLLSLGGRIFTNTEVTDIDVANKAIVFRDTFGRQGTDNYDYLILATGSKVRQFPIPGMQLDGIFTAKSYADARAAMDWIVSPSVKRVAIVGGGYVGCEMAEACQKSGKQVILYEEKPSLMADHFDAEISKALEKRLLALGVEIRFAKVRAFRGTDKVQQIVYMSASDNFNGVDNADMVLSCPGLYPIAELCPELRRSDNGAYTVNQFQQTTQAEIYAVGDCSASYNDLLKRYRSSFFASNAIRTANVACSHILRQKLNFPGAQDTSALLIDGVYLTCTGMCYGEAKAMGLDVNFSDYTGQQFPEFMKISNPYVYLRIVYTKKDRILIGAQMASEYDMTSAIYYYALAVQEKISVDALSLLDLFFMPHFNYEYNYHMLCALGAP